jgi:lysozyme
MKASDKLISKLKEYEGLRLNAYKCPAGAWTIGYGHTKGVKQGDVITAQQAEQYLREDLYSFEQGVIVLAGQKKFSMTQGQFDALVDFAYNLGLGTLRSSTLVRRIAAGAGLEVIQAEFKKWVRAGGKVLPGLVRRREWEAQRYAETD